jgi:hypothetical protein
MGQQRPGHASHWGVILAVVAAHLTPGGGLETAAYMLLFHAAAVLEDLGSGLVLNASSLAAKSCP